MAKKKTTKLQELLKADAKARRHASVKAGAYDGRFAHKVLAKNKKQTNKANRRSAKRSLQRS